MKATQITGHAEIFDQQRQSLLKAITELEKNKAALSGHDIFMLDGLLHFLDTISDKLKTTTTQK